MRIPYYCPVCLRYYPGPVEVSGDASITFENVSTRCPLGHEALFVDGTHSIQDGILTVVRNRPEVLELIKGFANDGLSGKIKPDAAVRKIEELIPEISPAIKEKIGSSSPLEILGFLVALLSCIFGAIGAFKSNPGPQTIINNVTNNYQTNTPSGAPQTINKELAKKKDKRKAQRKARRIGRSVKK